LQHCLGASANSRSKIDRLFAGDIVELLRLRDKSDTDLAPER
jgi:hypothetical protein